MPANNVLGLINLDFDSNRADLQNFLSSQTELADYNFEGSTLQILLNLLAFNTYKNAFYTNMVGNEMFLDSAQLRSSVVSRAKELGYTPNSITSPTATIRVEKNATDSDGDPITIEKNTKFTTTINGITYNYVNLNPVTISKDANDMFIGFVNITEGEPLTHRFTVNSTTPTRYIIPNDNVDKSRIIVRVQNSLSDDTTEQWNPAENITNITKDSRVYYLSENENERYELQFGDGIISRQLVDGNIVIIEYLVSTGLASEGATIFNTSDGFEITTISPARGGADKEDIESIKFSAVRANQTQDRAVNSNDYEGLIKRNFPDLVTVATWGGEENNPPNYGTVYISGRPKLTSFLSEQRKSEIKTFISNKNVGNFSIEVIDPVYLYIQPTIDVRYDPNVATISANDLANRIADAVKRYETRNLNLFRGKYINSALLAAVGGVNPSILSTSINFIMENDVALNTSRQISYNVSFNNRIYRPYVGAERSVSSSKFTFQDQECYFDDDGTSNIRIYSIGANNTRVYLNNRAGTIDYSTGEIFINSLSLQADNNIITIRARSEQADVESIRNQLLLIRNIKVNIIDNTSVVASITVANTV